MLTFLERISFRTRWLTEMPSLRDRSRDLSRIKPVMRKRILLYRLILASWRTSVILSSIALTIQAPAPSSGIMFSRSHRTYTTNSPFVLPDDGTVGGGGMGTAGKRDCSWGMMNCGCCCCCCWGGGGKYCWAWGCCWGCWTDGKGSGAASKAHCGDEYRTGDAVCCRAMLPGTARVGEMPEAASAGVMPMSGDVTLVGETRGVPDGRRLVTGRVAGANWTDDLGTYKPWFGAQVNP